MGISANIYLRYTTLQSLSHCDLNISIDCLMRYCYVIYVYKWQFFHWHAHYVLNLRHSSHRLPSTLLQVYPIDEPNLTLLQQKSTDWPTIRSLQFFVMCVLCQEIHKRYVLVVKIVIKQCGNYNLWWLICWYAQFTTLKRMHRTHKCAFQMYGIARRTRCENCIFLCRNGINCKLEIIRSAVMILWLH